VSLAFIFIELLSKKKYVSWRYFLLGVFFYFCWIIIYLLSFTTTFNTDILLYFSRALYSLSFLASWSMTFFFFYYGYRKNNSAHKDFQNIFIIIAFILFLVSISTALFIQEMVYDATL
jgi:hypothetical protein